MFSDFGNELKYAVKYTRVSTNQQDDRGSKEIQDLKINEFANKNNFKIVNSFTDTDHGDNPLRPGINALKSYLKGNSEVKYVICLFQDRFTRDFREGLENLYFLKDLGVSLVTVNEGLIKMDGTFDSIPALIRFIGAQEEKTKIVKKTTDSMYNYANTNRFLGGSILPWFKLEKISENGKRIKIIVKNEETWNIYRKFFIDIIRMKSVKKAALENSLNPYTVRDWVKMPELIGYRTYGKKGKINSTYKKGRRTEYMVTSEKVLPAILTEEEYAKIDSVYKTYKVKFTSSKFPYLFTTLLHCECGGRYFGNSLKNRYNTYYHYYKCEKCAKRYNAKNIEQEIIDAILENKNLNMLNDYNFRIADLYDQITILNKKIEMEKAKEKNIVELMLEGIISNDISKEKLRTLKSNITNIEKEKKKLEEQIEIESNKEITEEHIESLKFLLKNYDEETVTELKEILNLIIQKIVLSKNGEIEIIF